jgi:hypothetical protein
VANENFVGIYHLVKQRSLVSRTSMKMQAFKNKTLFWVKKACGTVPLMTHRWSHPAVVDIRSQDPVQDPLLNLAPVPARLLTTKNKN